MISDIAVVMTATIHRGAVYWAARLLSGLKGRALAEWVARNTDTPPAQWEYYCGERDYPDTEAEWQALPEDERPDPFAEIDPAVRLIERNADLRILLTPWLIIEEIRWVWRRRVALWWIRAKARWAR